jgi:hypothetical protein
MDMLTGGSFFDLLFTCLKLGSLFKCKTLGDEKTP